MTIAFVNGVGAHESGSSTTIALPSFDLTAGNAVIVGVSNYTSGQPAISSISDSAGNTYGRCGSAEHADGSHTMEVWAAYDCTAHASNVVTISFSASAAFRVGLGCQYSGIASNGFDAAGSIKVESSSVNVHQTNSAVTTQDDEIALGFFIQWAGTSASYSASAPDTVRVSQDNSSAIVDRIVESAGSTSVQVTVLDNEQASILRTFKADTGGGTNSWSYSGSISAQSAVAAGIHRAKVYQGALSAQSAIQGVSSFSGHTQWTYSGSVVAHASVVGTAYYSSGVIAAIAEINLKTSVAGLVAGRVFPAMLPIGTALPAIVYSRISGVPVGLLYQDTGGTEVHVQLDIYAETYAAVRGLVSQVRTALDAASYVTRLESEQSLYEQDTRLHRALLDVYVYEP